MIGPTWNVWTEMLRRVGIDDMDGVGVCLAIGVANFERRLGENGNAVYASGPCVVFGVGRPEVREARLGLGSGPK